MNTVTLIPQGKFLAFSFLASASLVSAEITKAATGAEIEAQRRQLQSVYEDSGAAQVEGEVKIDVKKPSLLASSEFLVGPHGFTLVPKGAVIATGRAVAVENVAPKGAKLLNWSDFLQRHRGGLRLLPVTDNQWTGKESLDPLLTRIEAAEKSGYTTLTSLNGEPVSLPKIQKLLESKE
ncbi:hypothetical protein [Roseibacillus persicicus]|uniref:hypothetical protein n=1 Tax=Roseibacillus persicicus TaxID=454148 RepID=UPI00280C57C7|nr:hypothetical protein [Roseibacillus persicicus]MDQ8192236.1 hypothetical protein [Roseibacillus persicicus]